MYRFSTRLLIGLVFVSIVTLAGYGGLAYIVFKQRDEVATLDEALAFEKDKEERLRSLHGLLEDVGEGREVIDSQFLSSDEDAVVAYIRLLETLDAHVPVEIDLFSVNLIGEPSGGETLMQVRVSVVGTEDAIVTFVELVENLPVVTLIDTLNLTSREEEGLWSASFVLLALVSE